MRKNTSGRGGYRPGAGRPKTSLQQRELKKLLRAVRKEAKAKNTTWQDEYAKMMFDRIASPKERLATFKILMEHVLSKHTEKDINVNHNQGPKIGLPEMRPDPAKLISIKGGLK